MPRPFTIAARQENLCHERAYISSVYKEILEIAHNSEEMYNYDRIRLQLEYQNVVMHIWFYCKIYSHLRQSGIVSKIVDLLQGRDCSCNKAVSNCSS